MDSKNGKGVERRRQEAADAGSSLVCVDVDDKGKHKGRASLHWQCVLFLTHRLPFCRINLVTLGAELKAHPARVIKRLLINCFAVAWCVLVLLSLLSLMGWQVNPNTYLQGSSLMDGSASRAISKMIPSSSILGGSSATASFGEDNDDDEDDNDSESAINSSDSKESGVGSSEGEEEEAIPEQMVIVNLYQKVTKKMERAMTCVEQDCQAQCKSKAKPKCAKSRSCMQEREKICKKRCRKTRCEERCKDDPKLGYVEREQKMDKCKESCTGATAVHNKCIKKCHSEYKPCKQRCHETAGKFACDRLPVALPLLGEPKHDRVIDMSSKQLRGKASNRGGTSEDDEDEDEGDSMTVGGDDDDELL